MRQTKKETRHQRFDRHVSDIGALVAMAAALLVGFIALVCIIVGVASL